MTYVTLRIVERMWGHVLVTSHLLDSYFRIVRHL